MLRASLVTTARSCVQRLLSSQITKGQPSRLPQLVRHQPAIYLGWARACSSAALDTQQTSQLDLLKQRGLYEEDVLKHVKSPDIKSLEISEDRKMLDIIWGDGHVSKFHACWLRHQCHCRECRQDFSAAVTVDFMKIDTKHLKLLSATMDRDNVVVLRWEDKPNGAPHEGPIPAAYLRYYCYSDTARQQRRQARAMRFHEDKTLPVVNYSDISTSEVEVFKWLSYLNDRGICLVKNVPTNLGMVAEVAKLIAPIQPTAYGQIFDVVSSSRPSNAAYSSIKLSFHQDQMHYEASPGLQLLHCLEFDPHIVGGNNTFADMHEVANVFRKEKPVYFDIMSKVPIVSQTIQYSNREYPEYPVHLQSIKPIFAVNPAGELAAVNWHPVRVGPLNTSHENVELFFEAYQHFSNLLNNYESIVSCIRDLQQRIVDLQVLFLS